MFETRFLLAKSSTKLYLKLNVLKNTTLEIKVIEIVVTDYFSSESTMHTNIFLK